jgi:hypothetical protein
MLVPESDYQSSVPADLTLASDLVFVFNASRVRLECCVDPLRSPLLSGIGCGDLLPTGRAVAATAEDAG